MHPRNRIALQVVLQLLAKKENRTHLSTFVTIKRSSLIHYFSSLQPDESDAWYEIWNEWQELKFAHQVGDGMVSACVVLCSLQLAGVSRAPRLRASRFGRAQCAREEGRC